AKVEDNVIASTGAAGFVMFGPYVALVPGTYHVAIQGSIPAQGAGEVRFDAVSNAAAVTHGRQVVSTATPLSGTIAEFNITVPEGVTDFEIRAEVTEGAVV